MFYYEEDNLSPEESFKRTKKSLQQSNFIWENYSKILFSKYKINYTPYEKTVIKKLLFNPLPEKYRKQFWLISSGAKRDLINNKDYYYNLLENYPKNIPFPYEENINLDLHRTFPEIDFFKDENNLKKMKNILMAFAMRNISIGYCQGFNFIVGKLLMIIENEEETFWVFTNICENYLPFDFYLQFTGVRTDIEIIKKIIYLIIPNMINNENFELSISNLIAQCFISLFSNYVNDNILFCIWDSFFIYGNIILYKAFIWVVSLIYEENINNYELSNIQSTLFQKMKIENKTDALNYYLMVFIRFNSTYVEHYRNKISKETIKENNSLRKRKINYMNNIKCDKSMPFCLYYNEIDNIVNLNQFYVLRCNQKIDFRDDYFWGEYEKDLENYYELEISINDLLIEHQIHYCPDN
jgi:hypothetical protein